MSTEIEHVNQSMIPVNSIVDLKIPDTEEDITEFVRKTDSAQREGVLITRWKQGQAIVKLVDVLNKGGDETSLFEVCNKAAKQTEVQHRTLLYAARVYQHHPMSADILRYSRAGLSWNLFMETILPVYGDGERKKKFLKMLDDVIEAEGFVYPPTVRELAASVMAEDSKVEASETPEPEKKEAEQELSPSQQAIRTVGNLAEQFDKSAVKYERGLEQFQADIEGVFDPAMSEESHDARCRDAATIVTALKRMSVTLSDMLAITALTSHTGRKTAVECAKEVVIALARCGVEPVIGTNSAGRSVVRFELNDSQENSEDSDES